MTWDETSGAVSERPRVADETVDAVVEGWSRLFTYLVVATLFGLSVITPFFGLLLALAGASYLRAGQAHARRHAHTMLRLVVGPLTAPLDLIRGVAGTLLTVPYAAVCAVAVPMGIMAAAAVGVQVAPLVAAAWGAGAGAYVLLAAPGVRAPRRHLVEVFTVLANGPRRIAVVGALLCVVTLAVLAAAIVLRPTFAPMYELENSIAQELSRFQDSIQQRVS
jgi:eukaryotic-like serine/threonine-protein kinase